MKKGQITIILVIIIVILIAVIIFQMTKNAVSLAESEKNAKKVLESGLDTAQVNKLGEECLASYLRDALDDTYFKGYEFDDLSGIEDRFSQEINSSFPSCLDLSFFIDKIGYDITSRYAGSNITIMPTHIRAKADHHLTLRYRDNSAEISSFIINRNEPLGMFLNATNEIYNDMVAQGTNKTFGLDFHCNQALNRYTYNGAIYIERINDSTINISDSQSGRWLTVGSDAYNITGESCR